MELAFAHGGPVLRGRMRVRLEDFRVDEILGYEADGAGEHVLLQVEKRECNTDWVARELARFAGVAPRAVGYAGRKDRHAVTRQAFTIGLAGKPEPDWPAFPHAEVRILSTNRHGRKLRIGALRGNRFEITLRDIDGDRAQADAVLGAIGRDGVPNYFGAQRFGHHGDNVEQAMAMFAGKRVPRNTRSILLSAARAQVFNGVLDQRVRDGTWNKALDGEIWCLAGSRAWFGPEPFTQDLAGRLESGDIHPSGPLWGKGEVPSTGQVAAIEQTIGANYPDLLAGLASAGLEQARRPLRLPVGDLAWHWADDRTLVTSFRLGAGCYATSVLRELVDVLQISAIG